MAEERSEEARAAGLLYPVIGGQVVELPVLRIRKAREWKKRLGEVEVEGEHDMDYPIEVMLDLLVAYDVQGVLGSRDSVEDRATDREVYDAFREVMAATFPFVPRPESILTDDFTRKVVASLYLRGSSTSGRSVNGGSTPTRSKRRSPRSNSNSSTTQEGLA